MPVQWKTCFQNSPRLILENLILTPVKAVVSTGILRQGCFNGFQRLYLLFSLAS